MAAPKILQNVLGRVRELVTIATSAGATDGEKVPSTNTSGFLDPTLLNAKNSSAGAADSGKIPQLDASGRLSSTFLPVGIGADTTSLPATETLAAGDLVNVWNSSGTASVRKADATAEGKEAHGFVTAAVTSGATATVYFEGRITGKTGLTPGARQYLSASTPGAVTATAPTTSGNVVQYVGIAVSATEIDFEKEDTITLA